MPGSNQITTKLSSITKKKTISWASSAAERKFEVHQNAKQIWFQKDELMAIHKEILDLASWLLVDDKDNSCRGLEAYLDVSATRTRALRRRELIQTVLEEQEDQRRHDTAYSPGSIAELSEEISNLSMKEALARGLNDEHVAAHIHQEVKEKDDYKKAATTKRRLSRRYSKMFRKTIRVALSA